MHDRPNSIIHINSYFITSSLHGELVTSLDKQGIEQQVFVPVQRAGYVNKNLPKEMQHGQVHYAHCFNTFDRYLWPLKMFKIWRSFKKRFAANPHPALIHAHSLIVNGLIAFLAYKKWGVPYIVSVRFTDVHVFMKRIPFFKIIGFRILKNARAIVFLSPAYRDYQLPDLFKRTQIASLHQKSHVIPNGIHDYWLSHRERETPGKRTHTIVFVGSMTKRKNPIALLKACELLHNEGIPVKVLMVGSGPLKKKLEKIKCICEVVWLGQIHEKDQLIDIYRKSDLLVVPSLIETFGLVYPEAMSQGLPVLYSRNQGFDGYYPEGHVGFSVNPKDPADIAEKIQMVYADYSRISSNACKASADFSWGKISDQLIDLYKSISIQ